MHCFSKKIIKEEKSRNLNLDLIRAVAILFVICDHFLLHNGFYTTPIYGIRLDIMVIMRSIFIWCVPFFLLLTGFLNSHKKYSKNYYNGIKKILCVYITCSICCFIFKTRSFSIITLIKEILSFQAAPYSWYVNMYIGLFLLIPFLNQFYQSLTKEQKRVFMISLIFISILPSLNFISIFPNYWVNLWPLVYYFTGSYIREYQERWSFKKISIIFFAVFLLSIISNIILNYGKVYSTASLTDYAGIETYFLSVLCFMFLLKLNLSHIPKLGQSIITHVAKYSFGMYLISYCFDQIAYQKLNTSIVNVGQRLDYFFVVILFVFSCSYLSSFFIEEFCNICLRKRRRRKPMKRKLIFFGYDLRIGGIENALVELLKNINYEKYDVTLVLEHIHKNETCRLPKEVQIQEYHVSSSSNVIFRKLCNFLNQIRFFIKNYHHYDFSCSYATYSRPGSLLARISSKNSSIYIHSNYYHLYNRKAFFKFFNGLAVEKFKHIFFVSNESRDDFLKYYPELEFKTIVCNNFVDEDRIKKLSKEKISNVKNHKILFTFVGRLDESSKRITRLINLIKYLKQKNVSIECWIIGDGPDYEKYSSMISKEKLKDNIILYGAQMNPYPYMKKSDYVILTSKYEGFPVIYLESIVLGKKIITTVDVSDETISIPNRFGYVISNEDGLINKEVENIINNDHLKIEKVDFKKINKEKQKLLEKVFDNV